MKHNQQKSPKPIFSRILNRIKDQVLRREKYIPIDKYNVKLHPQEIKNFNVTMTKPIVTRYSLINHTPKIYDYSKDDVFSLEISRINYLKESQKRKNSLTFNAFTPFKVSEVDGYNTKKSLLRPKNWVMNWGRRGKDVIVNRAQNKDAVFHLALPSLYPQSTFNYKTLFNFPKNKSLFPFQRDGVTFLLEKETALLADEMGLGKSIQAIVATGLLLKYRLVKKCLVVCPKSVLRDWESKFKEWAKELSISKISGTTATRRRLWTKKAHVFLVTYDTLREDVLGKEGKPKSRFNFDLVILDEIQRIKNSSTLTYKAVNKLGGTIRWGLSGTPLENRVEDLTTIFSYLKPKLFNIGEISDPIRVKTMITPFILRRTKNTVLKELPEKIHNRVVLDLEPKQRTVYDLIERKGITYLKEKGQKATMTHIMALISKLKQICNIEPVSGESSKLNYLKEMLTNLSGTRDKMIVFSQYPEKTLKLIEPSLREFNPLIYQGSLTNKKREEVLKQFKEDSGIKILLMSLKAGGLGLTLTTARYVTHFDSWWNPAVMAQAEDRTHRIGQNKTVFVTSLITQNTVEERIQRILEDKRTLFREVIGEMSTYRLTGVLTEKELFGLFGLQRTKASKQRYT